MGWLYESAPEHEGYFVAIEKVDDIQWRELGFYREACPVKFVRVACDCGWRSPLLYAPTGTNFAPSIVILPERDEWFEEEGRARWREHVELESLRKRQEWFGCAFSLRRP